MTYNGYQVNPVELRKRGEAFSRCAQTLEAARVALAQALGEEGTPWGNDQYGAEFVKGHLPLRDGIAEQFSILVKALHDIKGGLDEMATRYEGAERSSRLRT